MYTPFSFIKGTSAQIAAMIGAIGNVIYNTDKNTLVLQDGATQGGFELMRGDMSNAVGGAAKLLTLDRTGAIGQVLTGAGVNNAPLWAAPQASPLQSVSASVASNALTLSLPATSLQFRNPTLATGAPVSATFATPLSIVVPSGATLGTVANVSAQLALLVAYNGGTPVLCVANPASGLDLSETGLISPTTITSSASSAGTIYSASAVTAGSPYRLVGFVTVAEATPGTWSNAPSLVQPGGGVALNVFGVTRVLLDSITFDAVSASNKLFLLPDGFDSFEIEWIDLHSTATGALAFQVSPDGGATFYSASAGYTSIYGQAASSGAAGSSGSNTYGELIPAFSTNTGQSSHGKLKLNRPKSAVTSRVRTYSVDSNFFYSDASLIYRHYAGYVLSTATYNALRVYCSTGLIDSGVIKLYGVK